MLASSAVLQASEWLAVTQVASCGELQLNLGATQLPSSLMPASIAALSSGNFGCCSMQALPDVPEAVETQAGLSVEVCTSSSEHRLTGEGVSDFQRYGIDLHLMTILVVFRQPLFFPILVVSVPWIWCSSPWQL